MRDAIEQYRLPCYVSIHAEAPPPQVMAEYYDPLVGGLVFFVGEAAAYRRFNPQQREEASRDHPAGHPLGLAFPRENRQPGSKSCHTLKRLVLLSPVNEIGQRGRLLLYVARRIVRP